MRLQQRLYQQLMSDESMPSKSTKSIEQQTGALVEAAAGRKALIVVDGARSLSDRVVLCFISLRRHLQIVGTPSTSNILMWATLRPSCSW